MSQFPSSIISFSTKINGQVIDASDINSPQDEITALETKVGADGSADTTSLDYLVKNPASDGGGHVQVANKGGTGQTSYNKGDLLVASSSSVLAKLAVGADGTALVANSNTTTGLNYQTFPGKVYASTYSYVYTNKTGPQETSILSINIPASTLGTNNVIRTTVYLTSDNLPQFSVLTKVNYGGGVINSVMTLGTNTGNPGGSAIGRLIHTIFANESGDIQRGILELNLGLPRRSTTTGTGASTIGITDVNTTSIASGAVKNLGITFMGRVPDGEGFNINGILVEKIS